MALVRTFLLPLHLAIVSSCPRGYTFCGDEGDVCIAKGDQIVSYGIDGVWAYKDHYSLFVDEYLGCNDDTFGDPVPTNLNPKECCR